MASPKPVPSPIFLVVNPAWKIFFLFFSSIPNPLSLIKTKSLFSLILVSISMLAPY